MTIPFLRELLTKTIREVPVEKVVERVVQTHTRDIIEVPVEKIIERVVKVPQETIVEVPVERVIEKVCSTRTMFRSLLCAESSRFTISFFIFCVFF